MPFFCTLGFPGLRGQGPCHHCNLRKHRHCLVMVRNKYVGRRPSFVWLHGQSVQFIDGLHPFPIGHHCLGLCSRFCENANQPWRQTALPFAVQADGNGGLTRQIFFAFLTLGTCIPFQFGSQSLDNGFDWSAECASKRTTGFTPPL